MKVFTKEGDNIRLIAMPNEEVNIGEYLCIKDKHERELIIQVFDVQYPNIQGVFEDLLRNELVEEVLEGNDADPLGVSGQISFIKDAKLTLCKVRGVGSDSDYVPWGTFLPSRSNSKVTRVPLKKLIHATKGKMAINLGTACDSDLFIDVKKLDGKLNIITGRKGTGKSHLSKALLLGLIDNNAPCIILDVNGEYLNLGLNVNGKKNCYYEKLRVLSPGKNFKFPLSAVGLNSFINILSYALELPWNSMRIFIQIWHHLKETGKLNHKDLGESIKTWKCHETIREALGSRYTTLINSGIFDDNVRDDIYNLASFLLNGGAVIIDLKDQNSVNRRIIVELILSKLKDLLYNRTLPAVFLFAEEAHLYLRETYWNDIVTRMRHLGLFATFITNQPDTINDSIYRQADNIFIFNFLNEKDIDMVSRSAKIDSESVKRMVRALPPRHCLAIGETVNNFPIIIEVKSLNVKTMGETRLFFKDNIYSSKRIEVS